MHIHDSNSFSYANISPTAAAEHATARQRAENVRKRLMASANETDGITSPDEANPIARWMDPVHSRVLADDEYHASSPEEEADFA
jgi:hypothetical protein